MPLEQSFKLISQVSYQRNQVLQEDSDESMNQTGLEVQENK